jgi:hypothetical protein
MSYVMAVPELVVSAASDLSSIGSAASAAHSAAAAPTTGVLAAAEDEVSAAIASVFSGYGQRFQLLNSQAAAFHAEFVSLLSAGAAQYAAAEAANVSPLAAAVQQAQSAGLLSPWLTFTGRPLFGNGADGAAGSGQPGGNGG